MPDAPGPDGTVCGYGCDAWSLNNQCRIHCPRGRHAIEDALTRDMVETQRYIVRWSKQYGCFIRWTWWRNEVVKL